MRDVVRKSLLAKGAGLFNEENVDETVDKVMQLPPEQIEAFFPVSLATPTAAVRKILRRSLAQTQQSLHDSIASIFSSSSDESVTSHTSHTNHKVEKEDQVVVNREEDEVSLNDVHEDSELRKNKEAEGSTNNASANSFSHLELVEDRATKEKKMQKSVDESKKRKPRRGLKEKFLKANNVDEDNIDTAVNNNVTKLSKDQVESLLEDPIPSNNDSGTTIAAAKGALDQMEESVRSMNSIIKMAKENMKKIEAYSSDDDSLIARAKEMEEMLSSSRSSRIGLSNPSLNALQTSGFSTSDESAISGSSISDASQLFSSASEEDSTSFIHYRTSLRNMLLSNSGAREAKFQSSIDLAKEPPVEDEALDVSMDDSKLPPTAPLGVPPPPPLPDLADTSEDSSSDKSGDGRLDKGDFKSAAKEKLIQRNMDADLPDKQHQTAGGETGEEDQPDTAQISSMGSFNPAQQENDDGVARQGDHATDIPVSSETSRLESPSDISALPFNEKSTATNNGDPEPSHDIREQKGESQDHPLEKPVFRRSESQAHSESQHGISTEDGKDEEHQISFSDTNFQNTRGSTDGSESDDEGLHPSVEQQIKKPWYNPDYSSDDASFSSAESFGRSGDGADYAKMLSDGEVSVYEDLGGVSDESAHEVTSQASLEETSERSVAPKGTITGIDGRPTSSSDIREEKGESQDRPSEKPVITSDESDLLAVPSPDAQEEKKKPQDRPSRKSVYTSGDNQVPVVLSSDAREEKMENQCRPEENQLTRSSETKSPDVAKSGFSTFRNFKRSTPLQFTKATTKKSGEALEQQSTTGNNSNLASGLSETGSKIVATSEVSSRIGDTETGQAKATKTGNSTGSLKNWQQQSPMERVELRHVCEPQPEETTTSNIQLRNVRDFTNEGPSTAQSPILDDGGQGGILGDVQLRQTPVSQKKSTSTAAQPNVELRKIHILSKEDPYTGNSPGSLRQAKRKSELELVKLRHVPEPQPEETTQSNLELRNVRDLTNEDPFVRTSSRNSNEGEQKTIVEVVQLRPTPVTQTKQAISTTAQPNVELRHIHNLNNEDPFTGGSPGSSRKAKRKSELDRVKLQHVSEPQPEETAPSNLELRHLHDLTKEDPFVGASSRNLKEEKENKILESVHLRHTVVSRKKVIPTAAQPKIALRSINDLKNEDPYRGNSPGSLRKTKRKSELERVKLRHVSEPQPEATTPSNLELRRIHDLTKEDPFVGTSSRSLGERKSILDSVQLRQTPVSQKKAISTDAQNKLRNIKLRHVSKEESSARVLNSSILEDDLKRAKLKLRRVPGRERLFETAEWTSMLASKKLRTVPREARPTNASAPSSTEDKLQRAARQLRHVPASPRESLTKTPQSNSILASHQLRLVDRHEDPTGTAGPTSIEGELQRANNKLRHVNVLQRESFQQQEPERMVQLHPRKVADPSSFHLEQDDASLPDDVDVENQKKPLISQSMGHQDARASSHFPNDDSPPPNHPEIEEQREPLMSRRKARRKRRKKDSNKSSHVLCWTQSCCDIFWQVLVRTLVVLILLATIALPVYFLQFHDRKVPEKDVGSLSVFSTSRLATSSRSPSSNKPTGGNIFSHSLQNFP